RGTRKAVTTYRKAGIEDRKRGGSRWQNSINSVACSRHGLLTRHSALSAKPCWLTSSTRPSLRRNRLSLIATWPCARTAPACSSMPSAVPPGSRCCTTQNLSLQATCSHVSWQAQARQLTPPSLKAIRSSDDPSSPAHLCPLPLTPPERFFPSASASPQPS